MWTIPDIDKLLRKAVEVILTEFIPAITGGVVIITKNDRKLFSLAPLLGGLGIPIFEKFCKREYQNSIIINRNIFAMALPI